MSSGCLLTVSFNALQSPIHMNKIQAHMYATHTNTHDTHTMSHTKTHPCTHMLVHIPRCNLARISAGRLNRNYDSNSVTSVIISTTESEQIVSLADWLASWLYKSRMVK